MLGSSFNEEEINSILASLEFILSNSIRFDVEDSVLLKELIDLGLPKGPFPLLSLMSLQENLRKLRKHR